MMMLWNKHRKWDVQIRFIEGEPIKWVFEGHPDEIPKHMPDICTEFDGRIVKGWGYKPL